MGANQKNLRRCRVCGCDELHACETLTGPCHWVEEDLCSACAPRRERDERREAPDQGALLSGAFVPREQKSEVGGRKMAGSPSPRPSPPGEGERPADGRAELELTAVDIAALQGLEPIAVRFEGPDALAILSVLQLGARHPELSGYPLECLTRLAECLQQYISRTPNLTALAEAGWDTGYDGREPEADDHGGLILPAGY